MAFIPKGTRFFDPAVRYEANKSPQGLNPNYYIKVPDGGYFEIARNSNGPFKSDTYYLNEARPDNKLVGSQQPNVQYVLLSPSPFLAFLAMSSAYISRHKCSADADIVPLFFGISFSLFSFATCPHARVNVSVHEACMHVYKLSVCWRDCLYVLSILALDLKQI
jgi:hypothetical protein